MEPDRTSEDSDVAYETHYCSVAEAMKLITHPFDGDKKRLREFIENVDVAFEIVHPRKHEVLLKFVKTKITGDARSKLLVRDLTHSWALVKGILEENYAVRRTLDFYACRMFSARQERNESVASWGSRIDEMQTELREAAKRVCKPEELLGAVGLINHLGKACFVQGLNSERIQTIVRSRGESILLSQAVEISLEEEGAILSNREKSAAGGNTSRCTICNRLGHLASRCNKNGFPLPNARAVNIVRCFKCKRVGHLAIDCRQGTTWVTRRSGNLAEATCGPTGRAVDLSLRATSLDSRGRDSLPEAACKVQSKWTRSGNGGQGPISNQSRPQTYRQ